jgi:pimeloyl-ACP methyl ester carboxylesterase
MRIDLAKRFHEQIARKKLPEGPWSIFAVSLGAMIALDWVDAEPALFQNLFVVNTSSSDLASFYERFPLRHLPALTRAVLTRNPNHSESLMLKMASNRHLEMGKLLERQIAWRKERPISRKTALRQLFGAARFRLPKDRPAARTLVISSEGDRMVSPKISERLAQRIGATKVTHPWAGHDLAIDDPEWLSKQVAAFLPDVNAPKVPFRV